MARNSKVVNSVLGKYQIPNNFILVDFYPVNAPFAYAAIVRDRQTGRYEYRVVEPPLTDNDINIIEEIKTLVTETFDVDLIQLRREGEEKVLMDEVEKVVKKYKIKIPKESYDKILYYIKRDMLGYGKIDVMIRDEEIEDISCDGILAPIYVWHSRYESIPSNVIFEDPVELESILIKLSYRSGKQISIAQPVVEGALPEGYRIHLTLSEISRRGGTFTIRKFKKVPYSVIHLIRFGTLSPELAAYFWLMIEEKKSLVIIGSTASGKTTTLNAIATFIRPEAKIVTIEETPELNLPHENWIPLVTRPSYEEWVRNVDLFDLLKSALRMRPDYIIVGEIRGAEAFTLFQAIATGHAGMCTMHAENVDYAVKRLLSEPMNIPLFMLPVMNIYATIRRLKVDTKIQRKIVEVKEAIGIDPENRQVIFKDVFRYNPVLGRLEFLGDSEMIRQIAKQKFIDEEVVKEEIARRQAIIRYLMEHGVTDFATISRVIRDYYHNPDRVYTAVEMGVYELR